MSLLVGLFDSGLGGLTVLTGVGKRAYRANDDSVAGRPEPITMAARRTVIGTSPLASTAQVWLPPATTEEQGPPTSTGPASEGSSLSPMVIVLP